MNTNVFKLLIISFISTYPFQLSAEPGSTRSEKNSQMVELHNQTQFSQKNNNGQLNQIYIVDSKLLEVLAQFASNYDLTLNSDKSLTDRIHGRRYPLDKSEFLEKIGREFNLSLFEHNRTLFVTKKSDNATRMLNLASLNAEDVMKFLKESKIVFPQFPINIADTKKAIFVSGPKVYIELVKMLIEEYYSAVNPANLKVTTFGKKRNINLSTGENKPRGLFQ